MLTGSACVRGPLLHLMCLLAILFGPVVASAQKSITVNLSIVSRPASGTDSLDAGLLLDADNQLDQAVALYTPKGLLQHVRYYRLNPDTGEYSELEHPLKTELKREMALQDSFYRTYGAIACSFGDNDYNSKSGLYRQFTEVDSLWFDYQYNNSQYAKGIGEADLARFSQLTGLEKRAEFFTLMKSGERFQDFTNVTFLYQQPGEYKIRLDLPEVDLRGSVCTLDTFNVTEPKAVRCNELVLRVP